MMEEEDMSCVHQNKKKRKHSFTRAVTRVLPYQRRQKQNVMIMIQYRFVALLSESQNMSSGSPECQLPSSRMQTRIPLEAVREAEDAVWPLPGPELEV